MKAGLLIIVSAPSGGGKTSLVKALLETDKQLQVSVSHTTRKRRPGEQNGVNYHFVSTTEFTELQTQGEFLESAEVFGNHYGTSKSAIAAGLANGQDLVLEIDWQGAQQVQQNYAADLVSIFILPPSQQSLRERLRGRGQDAEQVINARMAKAINEMSHYNEYQYLVINDNFDHALADMQAIIRSSRLQLAQQQTDIAPLLDSLLSQ